MEQTLNDLEARHLDYRQKVDLLELEIQDLLEQADTDRATFLDKFEQSRQRARTLSDLLEQVDLELAEKELRYGIIKTAFEKMGATGTATGKETSPLSRSCSNCRSSRRIARSTPWRRGFSS